MSDRIAVMNQGLVEQIGTPTEIYDAPRTVFVAGFIGQANLWPGRAPWLAPMALPPSAPSALPRARPSNPSTGRSPSWSVPSASGCVRPPKRPPRPA